VSQNIIWVGELRENLGSGPRVSVRNSSEIMPQISIIIISLSFVYKSSGVVVVGEGNNLLPRGNCFKDVRTDGHP